MITTTSSGTFIITLALEGASFIQTERCRRIIHTLFDQGVFNVKMGKVMLYFDDAAELAAIDIELKKWSRSKPNIPLLNTIKNVKIEVLNPALVFELNQLRK